MLPRLPLVSLIGIYPAVTQRLPSGYPAVTQRLPRLPSGFLGYQEDHSWALEQVFIMVVSRKKACRWAGPDCPGPAQGLPRGYPGLLGFPGFRRDHSWTSIQVDRQKNPMWPKCPEVASSPWETAGPDYQAAAKRLPSGYQAATKRLPRLPRPPQGPLMDG
eukprot:gene16713-biopygen13160